MRRHDLKESAHGGFTLLELMTVLALMSFIVLASGNYLREFYLRYQAGIQLDATSRRFIRDAHFARTEAKRRQVPVSMTPRCANHWNSGWNVFLNPELKLGEYPSGSQVLLIHETLQGVTSTPPLGVKAPAGNQFEDSSERSRDLNCPSEYGFQLSSRDVHSQSSRMKAKHLTFNAVGAAQMRHGGFVANRIVFWSEKYPELERQILMGAGGRLRLCQPTRDNPSCKT